MKLLLSFTWREKTGPGRTLVILFLLLAGSRSFSQTLPSIIYRDTVNHFMINIPAGWKYGVSKQYPNLALIAYTNRPDTNFQSGANFNINIINKPASSLEIESRKLIGALESTNNLKLLKKDTVTIQGAPAMFVVETHLNGETKKSVSNLDVILYKNNSTYILTFVSSEDDFIKYVDIFQQIASSFTTDYLIK